MNRTASWLLIKANFFTWNVQENICAMQDPGGLGSREKILKTKEEEQQQTEYCFSFPCWSSSCSSPALLTTTIVDSSSVFINRVLDNGCVLLLLLQPKITLLSSSESTQQSSSRPIALALELLPVVIYLLVVKTCLQNVLKTNLTFLKEGFFQKQDFFLRFVSNHSYPIHSNECIRALKVSVLYLNL